MRILTDVAPRHAPALLAGFVAVNVEQMVEAAELGYLAPRRRRWSRRRRDLGRYPLGAHPVLSRIRSGRLVYLGVDPEEFWKTWARILRDDEDDCEGLVLAAVAELQWNGIPAEARAYQSGRDAQGNILWHVIARFRDPYRGWRWRYGDLALMAGMAT